MIPAAPLAEKREKRRSGSSGSGSFSSRSSKFAVYLNRSRAYARPARENLRSRSPDGHVNNLSVRFHRPRRPVLQPVYTQPAAPRHVWKIWSHRVPHVPRVSPSIHARVLLVYTEVHDIQGNETLSVA